MNISFISGNKGKVAEVQSIIPEIEQLDLDLIEIQEVDAHKVIEHKLHEAHKQYPGAIMVEDTSLYIDSMNGLPGPLIKWFLKTIDIGGVAKLVENTDTTARAKTIVGLMLADEAVKFFEGEVVGNIVSPRGDQGFGWDPIFQPKGADKTFAEMSLEEKNSFSMRNIALKKMADYLNGLD